MGWNVEPVVPHGSPPLLLHDHTCISFHRWPFLYVCAQIHGVRVDFPVFQCMWHHPVWQFYLSPKNYFGGWSRCWIMNRWSLRQKKPRNVFIPVLLLLMHYFSQVFLQCSIKPFYHSAGVCTKRCRSSFLNTVYIAHFLEYSWLEISALIGM